MIPSVFISSTIIDLHHLRSAVRDTIKELGLQAVMSEYSGVGFLPDQTAETSCYAAISQCQIAIVIIGKRYGSLTAGGVSATHNEFRTAFNRKIPIFCLVDSEVLAFRTVYSANPTSANLNFPGLENAQATFAFIAEVMESPRNNAILSYGSVADSRVHIRNQLAHLFGDLLSRHADPLKAEIRDVLVEVRTLRHALVKDPPAQTRRLLEGLRLLLDEGFDFYRSLFELAPGTLDDHLLSVLSAPSFTDAIEAATGNSIVILTLPKDTKFDGMTYIVENSDEYETLGCRSYVQENGERGVAIYGLNFDGSIVVDDAGLRVLEAQHLNLLDTLANPTQSRLR